MNYKLTIVALFFGLTSQAQKWHPGIKVDLNMTMMDAKGLRPSTVSGVQVGGFVQHPLDKKWSLQPELAYTMTNVKRATSFMTYYNLVGKSAARDQFQLHYVSVPILVRYELGSFSLLAGPQYSYMFLTNEDLLKSNTDAFKRNELSVNVGGQYNIGNFSLTARYNKGVSNINNIDDRYSWHSNHLQTGIAVRI